MIRLKKCSLIWLTLLLLLIATAVNAAEKNFVEIDIYSVNDFHGHLRAEAADPGIAVLSGVINELMKQNPVGSLLLGGGDMFSGTIDANEYQGLPVVTAMNKMGFSANTAGNHIFDYPLDVIKRQAAAANFPILGANIVEAAGDRVAEPFKPYVMLQRNGLTIGILGLTTVETKEKASQFNLQKVKILPPEQIAQVYVDELRRQGAQIIVLLTHIGSSQGGETWYYRGDSTDFAKNSWSRCRCHRTFTFVCQRDIWRYSGNPGRMLWGGSWQNQFVIFHGSSEGCFCKFAYL